MSSPRLVRGFRATGDSLTCHFAEDRSLAGASLECKNRFYDVTVELPGLNADNAEEYLEDLGFSLRVDPIASSVARTLNYLLRESRVAVEAVVGFRDTYAVGLIEETDRKFVCPSRLAVVTMDPLSSVIEILTVRDRALLREFFQRVSDSTL